MSEKKKPCISFAVIIRDTGTTHSVVGRDYKQYHTLLSLRARLLLVLVSIVYSYHILAKRTRCMHSSVFVCVCGLMSFFPIPPPLGPGGINRTAHLSPVLVCMGLMLCSTLCMPYSVLTYCCTSTCFIAHCYLYMYCIGLPDELCEW